MARGHGLLLLISICVFGTSIYIPTVESAWCSMHYTSVHGSAVCFSLAQKVFTKLVKVVIFWLTQIGFDHLLTCLCWPLLSRDLLEPVP